MEVFVVIGEYGSWDSFHTKILKVFDDEQKAKNFVKEYSSSEDIKRAKEIWNKIFYDGDMDDDGNSYGVVTEEDKEWQKSHPEFWSLREFDKCVIETYIAE